jgi:NAD(P)-dependent dehydrogenase (short-subunit alcohol dehydrogenase family)
MGRLDRKVALVTGAGQGVGRGIALALAAEGARVVVSGRSEGKLAPVCKEVEARGGRALAVRCDVGVESDVADCVKRCLDAFGRIDILVNNAQEVPFGRLLELTERDFDAGWRTGPLATWRFMRACHPHLKGGGNVVNLGTGAALRPDPVGYGGYAAVKEAIRALTRAAAFEWGPDGIRVNAVIPLASSPGLESWIQTRPQESAAFMATVPLGRAGDVEKDIGRAIAWLVSPEGAYITGTTLMLDGGQAYLR